MAHFGPEVVDCLLYGSTQSDRLEDEEGSTTVLFENHDDDDIELHEDPGTSGNQFVPSDEESEDDLGKSPNQGEISGNNNAISIGGNRAAWASISNLSSDRPTRPRRRQKYTAGDIVNPWKKTLYKLLEDPSSSSAAFWTNVFVSLMIFLSALTTTIETIPAFRSAESNKTCNTIVMTIEVMMVALKRSGDALSAFVFFPGYEPGIWDPTLETFVDASGNPSSFDSIPAAFWFVLVTITTTGYGDMVPTTFIGKLITFPAMMFGVLLIALPSIIIGRNFTIVWEAMRRYQMTHNGELPQSIGQSSEDADAASGRRDSFIDDIPHFPGIPSPSQNMVNNSNNTQLAEQVAALSELTRQNQLAIERILKLLEAPSQRERMISPQPVTTSEYPSPGPSDAIDTKDSLGA
ncbi:hypothetical protein NQZ79_g2628 [Umbelopsis isabellina]|nr:hypothetical protein NQZ79_g2628 [Umbelopsis isabellina]